MYYELRGFLIALPITIAIETIILWLLVQYWLKLAVGNGFILLSGIFANALTVPYVWFVFPYLFLGHYAVALIISELFALFVEALFYKTYFTQNFQKAFVLSFTANLVSYSSGYLIYFIRR